MTASGPPPIFPGVRLALAAAVIATTSPHLFFFIDPATTEIYTLSLHDALPIFCAIASCWPIGRPHCTRSAAQRRETSRQRLPAATDEMGSVRRPVFSVIRASFNPLPSPHRTLSRGTRTFLNEITPL